MNTLDIGVVGCAGYMGRLVARLAAEGSQTALAAGSEQPGSPAVGRDPGRADRPFTLGACGR